MSKAADQDLGTAELSAGRPAVDALWRLPPARVEGRLRPYRDVRAAFTPWRRMALFAWNQREESLALERLAATVH